MSNRAVPMLTIINGKIKEKRERQDNFAQFASFVFPAYEQTEFHKTYYKVLELFAKGKIKKLIVTVPPQHGKSQGSTILLPAYMLGLNPDLRIAIASYSATLATKFNRRAQKIIESREYGFVFPETRIKQSGKQGGQQSSFMRTSSEVEVISREGSLLSVGREGSLTGNRVDCFILDDLYKDAMEANSPLVRENCIEWYTSVVKTRMHNNSSELIVFTRWHEEDLIGHLLEREPYIKLESLEQIEDLDPDKWLYLNFEAIKASNPTPIDKRVVGEALWQSRHGVELLSQKRALDPHTFECLYQGSPSAREGLLYSDNFKTYTSLPAEDQIIGVYNYTDTADMGEDFLCSICYVKTKDQLLYITDIVFTQQPMEVTEPLVAEMLKNNGVRVAKIESNNGGRGFARAVQKLAPVVRIEAFNQGVNKEARILTNSATVQQLIIFPHDWAIRWREFYLILTRYKRQFKANKWHDAADVVTGIVEDAMKNKGKIKSIFKK